MIITIDQVHNKVWFLKMLWVQFHYIFQKSSLLNCLYLQVHDCKFCLLGEIILLPEFLKGENKCSVMKTSRIFLFECFVCLFVCLLWVFVFCFLFVWLVGLGWVGVFLHVCINLHLDKDEAVRICYKML